MKIEEVRTSFTVYLIAGDKSRMEGLSETLRIAGYMAVLFGEIDSAFSEISSNPPHMVILDFEESSFQIKSAIQQVLHQLPESHVYLLTPQEKRHQAATYLATGVYDLLLTPFNDPLELIKPLDRAAERDYFMYVSEKEPSSPPPSREETVTTFAPPVSAAADAHEELRFIRELFDHVNSDDCMNYFLAHVSKQMSSVPVIFLKYVANRRVLLATQAVNMDSNDWNGVGVNFNDSSTPFRVAQLRSPENLLEIRHLMKEVFGAENYISLVVESNNEVQGLVFLLNVNDKHPLAGRVREWNFLFSRALSLLDAEKRLHSVNTLDPQTELINREQFLLKLQQEVSRARRTLFPVSIAVIALDQFGTIVSQLGPEEAQPILRMVARIFEKHSRVNDVWGRTGLDEFAILMPHTGREGAMIKAERLRRIIESADFGRVLSSFSRLTISLGVCEYPSMVRDSEELIQTASEALDQVRGHGNKACVAHAPEGFVADFQPREKGT